MPPVWDRQIGLSTNVQVDVATCMEKYKLREGQLARLQENAGAFAAKVVAFCDRMGYAGLRAVLSLFQVGWQLRCSPCEAA